MNRWHKLAADIVSLWIIIGALFFLGVVFLCGLFVLYVIGVVVFQ